MRNIPVWIDDTAIQTFPELQTSINADVLVVGAGITGITTAYLLKKTGSTVALNIYNFEQLQSRVEQQVERIEAERISAIREALAGAILSK